MEKIDVREGGDGELRKAVELRTSILRALTELQNAVPKDSDALRLEYEKLKGDAAKETSLPNLFYMHQSLKEVIASYVPFAGGSNAGATTASVTSPHAPFKVRMQDGKVKEFKNLDELEVFKRGGNTHVDGNTNV